MTVESLKQYLEENWNKIKEEILAKKYKPSAVKRVYIPKGKDSVRPLAIPTAMDRVIKSIDKRKPLKFWYN